MIIGRGWGHSVELKENLKFETVKITNNAGQQTYLDYSLESNQQEGASFVTQVDMTGTTLPFDSVKRVTNQTVTEVLLEDTSKTSDTSNDKEANICHANALCHEASHASKTSTSKQGETRY